MLRTESLSTHRPSTGELAAVGGMGVGEGAYRRRLVHLREVGRRYWSQAESLLDALPIARAATAAEHRWIDVALPDWAEDLGVGRPASLLVDASTVVPGDGPAWRRTDWWSAAFTHLHSLWERQHEADAGPIHSYSFRLPAVGARLFDHAWVNRIFLWLRRWAAHERGLRDEATFGPLPAAEFDLSHDVDAVAKSFNIRGKQSAFHLLNAGRLMGRGRWSEAAARGRRAVRFALSRSDYWQFEDLCELERRAGVRSTFHFYAGSTGLRSPKRWLFDPAYDVAAPRVQQLIRNLLDGGWRVGIHPGFDCWRDAAALNDDCARLHRVAGCEITRVRQHWLRFSWRDTWRTQIVAGLRYDGTLGFNNRIGFRNGAALEFAPWDFEREEPLRIAATPLVLMDSHLYDYQLTAERNVPDVIDRALDEVRIVGGRAGVLWHPHTLSDDYGWRDGYRHVLDVVGSGAKHARRWAS
jgi:hypothetical protein